MRNVALWFTLPALLLALGCESGGLTQDKAADEKKVVDGPQPKIEATTFFAHGNLLERQGQLEQAAVQYQRALELSPRFTSARNRLGIVYNDLGRHEDACAQFQLALADEPLSAHLHNNLGFSLYLCGRYADALGPLEQAMEYDPALTRAHMNYALAQGKLGNYSAALDHFRRAVPEADAQYNLAIMQCGVEQYAAAAVSLEAALAARPNFPEARQQLHEVARLVAEAEAAVDQRPEAAPVESNPPIADAATEAAPPAEQSATVEPSTPAPATTPSSKTASESPPHDADGLEPIETYPVPTLSSADKTPPATN